MTIKSGDIIYYVDPFIFVIEKLQIEFTVKEDDGVYYIESSGAYLKKENLFTDLNEAKYDAMKKLTKFYHNKKAEIIRSNPNLDIGE